jgi:hypothetical protein
MNKPTMPRALKVEGATTAETLEHFMRLTDYYIDLDKWNQWNASVLQGVIDLAYIPHRSLTEDNDRLRKQRDALAADLKSAAVLLEGRNRRIAVLEAQVESLQNRWASRPLSSEDQARRIDALEAALKKAKCAIMRPSQYDGAMLLELVQEIDRQCHSEPETKVEPSAADIESDLWGEFNRERR